MKKLSLLVLVLIVGLPGCCGRKQESSRPVKNNTIEKYMDTEGDVVEDLEMDVEDPDADYVVDYLNSDFGDEDEEEDEYEIDADESDSDLGDIDLGDLEDEEEGTTFTWIDAQTDDEFKKLYFSFNHYGIRADQKESVNYDIEQVKQLIAESDSSAQPTIVIEGHACQEGTPAYNLALSEKRAKNVADLFVAAGVDRTAIKVVGRGQECPAEINGKAVNGSREDRAPNRRVEVRVIYT